MPDHSAQNCLFCKIARGEIPSRTAYQDEKYFAFHDIHPQAPTHPSTERSIGLTSPKIGTQYHS